MNNRRELVRNLEQAESGEIRRFRCEECGASSFTSLQQLDRHEFRCGRAGPQPAVKKNS